MCSMKYLESRDKIKVMSFIFVHVDPLCEWKYNVSLDMHESWDVHVLFTDGVDDDV